MTMKNTYLSLYLVEHLQVDNGLISLFPAISSAIMLLAMWLVMPRIGERKIHTAMIWGFMISALSNVIVIYPSPNVLFGLSVSTILAAVGTMMTYPYLEAAVANAIDDDNRASVFAILSVLILLFISPSGIIGGWAYAWDPRIPFVLIVLSFAASMGLMAAYRRRAASVYEEAEVSS
jgi:DHA1 family tetracycline resistance protein-like MFS transporter